MDRYNILDEKKIKNKILYKAEDKIYRKIFYIVEYETINYSDYKKDKKILIILAKLKEKRVIYDFIAKVSFDNMYKKFYKVFQSKNFEHEDIFNSMNNVSLIDVENVNISDDDVKTTIYSPLMIKDLNYIKTLEIDVNLKKKEEFSKIFSINDFLKLKTSLDIKLYSNSNYQLNVKFFDQGIILTQDKIIFDNKEIFNFQIKKLLITNYNYSYQLYCLKEEGEKILISDNLFLEDIQFLEKIVDRWLNLLPKEKLDITKTKDFSIFGLENTISKIGNDIEINLENLPDNATFIEKIKKYGYLSFFPLSLILLFLGIINITCTIIFFIIALGIIYIKVATTLVLNHDELKLYNIFAFFIKISKDKINHIDIDKISVKKQKIGNKIYYLLYIIHNDIEIELIKNRNKELVHGIKKIVTAWNKTIKKNF